MLKNDLILEDVMEVVLKDDKSWNPIRISLVCNELKKELTKKCVSLKKPTLLKPLVEVTSPKVVYNNKPDPVTKITEYEYTGDGLKKTKETVYDKPAEGKTYALTGGPKDKCIVNGYTWKESEVK